MNPVECRDYLGLFSKHWNIKDTVRTHREGWGFGCFDGGPQSWPENFGNRIDNVKAILDTGAPLFRLQAWWSKGSHKIAPLEALKRRLPFWARFAEAWPNVDFLMSPTCEYSPNTTREELIQRVKLIKQVAPRWKVVLSPMGRAVTIPGYIVERHGPGGCGKGEASSWDGQSCYDYDVAAWKRKTRQAVYRMWWGLRDNLAESIKDKNDKPIFIPCPNRTATPNDSYHESVNVFSDPVEPEPVSPFPPGTVRKFSKPRLYKTHAEDMSGDGPRDNRPLIIVEAFDSHANVVACNGVSITTFPRFNDTKPHQLERYYSGLGNKLWGWQIANIAKRVSESPYVWFIVNGIPYGPVHPVYREDWYPPIR